MNASKLMKVNYFDPKSDIRLLCYADTVVWDIRTCDTRGLSGTVSHAVP